jgi:5-formyltetrahydrofolate cyclo-ligase
METALQEAGGARMTVVSTKQELREQMRARLAAQSAVDVQKKSADIWERLSVLDAFTTALRSLIYISKAGEVDTRGLIQQLLAMGRQVYVPWFDAAQKQYIASELLDFALDLKIGQFGILEPKPEALRPVGDDRIDTVLVPGLAFDETGNRLGRGKGYFDRLLQDLRGVKIALAYDFQIVGEVPTEAHDAAVDFIVTEKRVIKTKGNPK